MKIPGFSTAVGDSYLFREIPFPHCSTFSVQTPIMHSLAVFAFPHHWEPSKSMQSFGGIKNKGELYFNVPLKSKATLPGLLLFFFFLIFIFAFWSAARKLLERRGISIITFRFCPRYGTLSPKRRPCTPALHLKLQGKQFNMKPH